MYHITERNERQGRRHALVLAIALHLALVAMLYFKMTSEPAARPPEGPAKTTLPAAVKAKAVNQP